MSRIDCHNGLFFLPGLFHDGPIPSVSDSGLSKDDLCSLPIGSPIVTTALNDVTTVNTRVLADGTVML